MFFVLVTGQCEDLVSNLFGWNHFDMVFFGVMDLCGLAWQGSGKTSNFPRDKLNSNLC